MAFIDDDLAILRNIILHSIFVTKALNDGDIYDARPSDLSAAN
jgi:hypothetical protein